MNTELVFNGVVNFKEEDNGCALIAEIDNDEVFFIRLHSWDNTKQHEQAQLFAGKKVKITIETMDE